MIFSFAPLGPEFVKTNEEGEAGNEIAFDTYSF